MWYYTKPVAPLQSNSRSLPEQARENRWCPTVRQECDSAYEGGMRQEISWQEEDQETGQQKHHS
jgi:hypothetical protein